MLCFKNKTKEDNLVRRNPMKKVLSVITCSILAACSCNENQWEEVDAVTFEDVVYVEEAEANKAPVIVEPAPVYVQAPQPVNFYPQCAFQRV